MGARIFTSTNYSSYIMKPVFTMQFKVKPSTFFLLHQGKPTCAPKVHMYSVESLYVDSLKSGHPVKSERFILSQSNTRCTIAPLKSGHLSNQDIFSRSKRWNNVHCWQKASITVFRVWTTRPQICFDNKSTNLKEEMLTEHAKSSTLPLSTLEVASLMG